MNKIYTYIRSHASTTLSVFAIAALLVSNWHFMAKAEEGAVPPAADSATPGEQITKDVLSKLGSDAPKLNLVSSDMPNANCLGEIMNVGSPSTTYVDNAPYNMDFFNGGNPNTFPSQPFSSFQDVNGDNLPDYVYAYSGTSLGGSYVQSVTATCLYLNNGSGWTKTYRCYALTQVNYVTGESAYKEYRGDCAG